MTRVSDTQPLYSVYVLVFFLFSFCLHSLVMVPVAGVAFGGEGVLGKGFEGRHRVSNPRAALVFSFTSFVIILFIRKLWTKLKKR